jgi:vacuolar-type H+-ATPase subunit I/STV1
MKNEKKVMFLRPGAQVKSEDEIKAAQAAAVQAANGGKTPEPIADPKPEEPKPETPATPATPATQAGQLFPDPATKQSETVLKLSKRIAELEKKLRQEPQTIEERIEYYKRKQELTERYERYTAQVQHLDELRAKVEEANRDADDFGTTRDKYRLQLFAPSAYRDESVLSITNESLIDDVLDLLKNRMLKKAEELEVEISA